MTGDRGFFVTGTDTEVGKTLVSSALTTALAARGEAVAGFKPVASGSERTPSGLRNTDALQLLRASSTAPDYEDVNPLTYEPAIAPHFAAAELGCPIDVARLRAAHARLRARADWVVAEGAGGWRLPLGEGRLMSAFSRELGYPVVLVVGLRLGCINHALLTAEAIEADGLPLAGLVLNSIDPAYHRVEPTAETLRAHLGPKPMVHLPRLQAPEPADVADRLSGFLQSLMEAAAGRC